MNNIKIANAIATYGNINLEYLAVYHESIGYYILIKDANNDWKNVYWGFDENDAIPVYEGLTESPSKFKYILNNLDDEGEVKETDKALITNMVNGVGYNVYTVLKSYDANLDVSDNYEFELGYLLLNKITGSINISPITFEGLNETYQKEIVDIIKVIKNNELDKIKSELSSLLKYGKSPVRAKKMLAQYLEEKQLMILLSYLAMI